MNFVLLVNNLGALDLWLNSEDTRIKLKEKVASFVDTSFVKVSENLNLSSEDNCFGVTLYLDSKTQNFTAMLTSWNCSLERPFICSLSETNYTTPQKPSKFPCIPDPEKSRKKRSNDDLGKIQSKSLQNARDNISCTQRKVLH